MSPSMNHWIRIRKLRRQGIRLRLQQTGEWGGVAGREYYGEGRRSCKASQQHQANHKGERAKRGDPSEFARTESIHTRKKAGNAKHTASS